MPKSPFVRDSQELIECLRTAGGETLSFRPFFDALVESVPYETAAIVTTLPRGSLQVVQPPRFSGVLLKCYSKEFHKHDRIAWEAIARHQSVCAEDCWPDEQFENSRYFSEFLQPNDLAYVLAAPLAAPVLDGYPGAIELFRTCEQGPFNEDDVAQLNDLAEEVDRAIQQARQSRTISRLGVAPLRHDALTKMFVFDGNGQPRHDDAGLLALDADLRNGMLDLVRQRLGQVNGTRFSGDRVSLADSTGDLWNFRCIIHQQYPALGDGPFVFLCLQPACSDWSALRSSDFAADGELSRLIPAIRFMQENFSRGPTLLEIARIVHLSPFHFHRRFTELLGITPKHILLDRQIEQAKTELFADDKELSEVARLCGFAHQSHFTSRFKQATGLTPTRWRRLALDTKHD